MTSATTPPADPTDVVGRRAAAFLIDVILLGVLGLVVFAALRYRSYSGVPANACDVLSKGPDDPICFQFGSRAFLWHAGAAKTAVIVTLFFALLNNVVLQSITGSTVGKMCFRLSVVDENGRKTHPWRMFGRWVFLVVDVGFCLVGCFMAIGTRPHRRIGDFVFATYVVAMRSVGRPVVVSPLDAEAAATGVGAPENWTAPPAPAPLTKALPAVAAGAAPQLKTPPGTAPTSPGEWGAVARPAPLVRSPQWATPPPTEPGTPPAVIESAMSPKWAAPPLPAPGVDDADDGAEATTADAKADEKPDETADDEKTDEKAVAKSGKIEIEIEPDADDDAPNVDQEPAADTEKETETDETDADADEAEPEVSEWSPVAGARKRKGAKATANKADASWWDAALSSGDTDAEVEAAEEQ